MLRKSNGGRHTIINREIIRDIISTLTTPTLKSLTAAFNERTGASYHTAYMKHYLLEYGLIESVYCKNSGGRKESFKRGNGYHYKVLFEAPLYSKLKGLFSSTDALWRTFKNEIGETIAVCNKGGRIAKYDERQGTWVELRQHMNNCGYLLCCVGNHRYCLTHILVYRAFNEQFEGECIGKDIDHIDCNRMNCNADNLRLLTHRENAIRRYRKEECKLF